MSAAVLVSTSLICSPAEEEVYTAPTACATKTYASAKHECTSFREKQLPLWSEIAVVKPSAIAGTSAPSLSVLAYKTHAQQIVGVHTIPPYPRDKSGVCGCVYCDALPTLVDTMSSLCSLARNHGPSNRPICGCHESQPS